MNRLTKTLPALIILALASSVSRADSVDQPPSEMRTWELTANGAAAYTRFTKTTSGGTQPIVSKSLLIINDDPAGGNDVFFDISSGTATTPTAGGTSVRVKPQESIRADGRFAGISIIAAAATVNIRVNVTF